MNHDKNTKTGSGTRASLSRRSVLKTGVSALGGAGLARASSAEAAMNPGPRQESLAGENFRAFVRYRDGVQVEELELLPIQEREVVVRTEASMACYSITPFALRINNYSRPTIMNHSGMGTVVEVGPTDRFPN